MSKENEKNDQLIDENEGFEELVLSAEFHDFKEKPQFTGKYIKSIPMDNGNVAHLFEEVETGEKVLVGNSYNIEKGLQDIAIDDKEHIVRIIFKGKKELKSGKEFNMFTVLHKVV